MEDSFVRKLTVPLDRAKAEAVQELLSSRKIEVYIKASEQDYCYLKDAPEFSEENLYVPEADHDYAQKLLLHEGYEAYICQESTKETASSELDKTMQDYYRKHRLHMIEWGVILLVVILYGLIRRVIG